MKRPFLINRRLLCVLTALYLFGTLLALPANADNYNAEREHCGTDSAGRNYCTDADITSTGDDSQNFVDAPTVASDSMPAWFTEVTGDKCANARSYCYYIYDDSNGRIFRDAIVRSGMYWDEALSFNNGETYDGSPADFNYKYKGFTKKFRLGDGISTIRVMTTRFPDYEPWTGCNAHAGRGCTFWSTQGGGLHGTSASTCDAADAGFGSPSDLDCHLREVDIVVIAGPLIDPSGSQNYCSGNTESDGTWKTIKHEMGHASGIFHSERTFPVMRGNAGGGCYAKVLSYDARAVEYFYNNYWNL